MIVDLRLSTAGSASTAGTGTAGREVTAFTCRTARRSGLFRAMDERAVKLAERRDRPVFLETSLPAGRRAEAA
jgi:hypothetical protein